MNTKSVAKVTGRFALEGVLTDPDAVTMIVTPPLASGDPEYVVTYPDPNLSRPEAGVFVGKVPIAGRAGRWRVEIVGVGTADSGAAATFYAFD